eukprot:CAMPEP_0116858808 /NCGR_PEP_ID=MMETSP0418-20121206/21403_1 /TAXON_ID=1158023 /ORGANISM="Astrosyne radiata, Strain 13vi08-1A" /LENGTH=79 /DNA_ID=CAMNT_0004492821 /DNA_START=144 /DNA_END=380 /DNA_ORIENTATION=+
MIHTGALKGIPQEEACGLVEGSCRRVVEEGKTSSCLLQPHRIQARKQQERSPRERVPIQASHAPDNSQAIREAESPGVW